MSAQAEQKTRQLTIRGAVKRLKGITVLDLINMPMRDVKAIDDMCNQLKDPVYGELRKREVKDGES